MTQHAREGVHPAYTMANRQQQQGFVAHPSYSRNSDTKVRNGPKTGQTSSPDTRGEGARMKLKSFKRSVATLLGVVALAVGTTATAGADPEPPTEYRTYAGVGSDTTQDALNGLGLVVTSGGNRLLASWDARPIGSTIKTKATGCQVPRPDGSGAGRAALVNSFTGQTVGGVNYTGCIDFARSSSGPSTSTPGGTYTYIPFGVDAVTVARLSTSDLPGNLTLNQLRAIYQCRLTTVAGEAVTPLLPQRNSGTRSYWLSQVAVTEADISAGDYPCLRDTYNDGTNPTAPIQEHDGRVLKSGSEIVPFSVAQYIAQGNAGRTIGGVLIDIEDRRGSAVIGRIGGVSPTVGTAPNQTLNTAFPINRDVYNVVPSVKITSGNPQYDATLAGVFAGASSQVCSNQAVINAYGFGTRTSTIAPNKQVCGSTDLKANS